MRVRILIDDFNLKDLDATIAALDAHPNIEVRLFNPFAHRGSRLIGFLTDFERVNHRMHNKLMVMDNAVAIVGGRNMSDPYFEVHPEFNFRDLDIAAAGPVVRDLSSVFDRFWNGPWSVPIAALVDRPYTEADLQEALKRLRENIAREPYPHPLNEDVAKLRSQLDDIVVGGIWARGQVVWDDPASINDPSLRTMRRLLVNRLERLERELLIESAYFIPLGPGVEFLKGLVSRGVRIRVLTNSLASNDVLAPLPVTRRSVTGCSRPGWSFTRCDRIRDRFHRKSCPSAPGPVCTPRPWSSTGRMSSSGASTSTRARA